MMLRHLATGLVVIFLAGQGWHSSVSAAGRNRPGQAVREITVVAERYEFTPGHIEVEQGDHVKISVHSADGTHGFAIKKLGIKMTVPRDGEPVTVEFDANEAGTFEIACFEYCGIGHKQMRATLVVNPISGHK